MTFFGCRVLFTTEVRMLRLLLQVSGILRGWAGRASHDVLVCVFFFVLFPFLLILVLEYG